MEQIAISIIELEMLFHWKRRGTCTKVTAISKYVKSIFALSEEDASGRASNFKTKKIFELAEVLKLKALSKHGFKVIDVREIISCQENVININKDESEGLSPMASEERVIRL
jgi:hypothetical protein